jgi:hypothetical protein
MSTHAHSLIDGLEDLARVDIDAGDGHYRKTSTHERTIKGKRRDVGHFYTQNLRIHALTHLTSADNEGRERKQSMTCMDQGDDDGFITPRNPQSDKAVSSRRSPPSGTHN